MTLEETLQKIHPLDEKAMEISRKRWDSIAKPLHSLGKMEDLVVQIAGITGSPDMNLKKRALVAMCADNGVVEEGVTQCGQEVTATVAENFLDEKSCVASCADGPEPRSVRWISAWQWTPHGWKNEKSLMERKIWRKSLP